MNFDTESYINTLLDNFTRNHAYYSYLKLKKYKHSSDKYFAPPYTQNLLSEEYQLYSIMKKNVSDKISGKNVSWDKKLHVEYNY